MRSEVRPPPPVEERGPQFHHCQISDIYKMCRSGDRVGLSGLIQVRVGQGWFRLELVKVGSCWSGWCRSGWVGLVRASQGGEDLWLGWVGWVCCWVVGLGWVVGWGWIRVWVGRSGCFRAG